MTLKKGDRVVVVSEYPPGHRYAALGDARRGKAGVLVDDPEPGSAYPYSVRFDDGDLNRNSSLDIVYEAVACHEVVSASDPDDTPTPKEATGPDAVYVSGPMRGLPHHNYPAFNAAADELRAAGWTVVNPAENFGGRTDLMNDAYLREDVRLMAEKCSAIYMLPGWRDSEGARLEWSIAKSLGFQIIEASPDWALPEPVEYEASRVVRNGQRQADYGHPSQDFRRTAGMWTAYLGAEVTPRDVAMMMAMLKISRLKSSPGHRDSLVDLVGYAICHERLDEQ